MPTRCEHQFIQLMGGALGATADMPVPDADWQCLYECAKANRMLPLLYQALRTDENAPSSLIGTLKQDARRSFVATSLTTRTLVDISAALGDLEWVLLRGPVLGQMLYGDLMLRPYGDLDVLVAPDHVDLALKRLQEAGFCEPASAFPTSYYRRYHLHVALERAGLAGPTALELHWAIDHPFSLLTIDVPPLLDRRVSVTVDQMVIPCLPLEDLFVALAIHAVKHAALLSVWIERHTPEQIAANGMLLHFYDLALMVQRFGAVIDWARIEACSAQWGAVDQVDLCLQALQMLWPDGAFDIPEAVIKLRERRSWERALLNWGSKVNSASLFGQLRGAFFRPVRLIDGVQYLVPPADYLMRRYGRIGAGVRLSHLGRALGELGGGGMALAYLSVKGALRRGHSGG